MSKIFPVILCGGAGHRLWPLSSLDVPKQFLKLFNDKTLLENTIDRLYDNENCCGPILLTNHKYLDLIQEVTKSYNLSKIVAEPESRNTAPAIISTIAFLYNTNPDDFVIVMSSDAYINDVGLFNEYLNDLLKDYSGDKIISFGIVPTEPNTNYGYIEKEIDDFNKNSIFSVKQFKEKPKIELALKFFQDKNFLWNSGIFVGKISTIYNLFKKYNPNLFENILNSVKNAENTEKILYLNRYFYSYCENISIDYSFMEKLNQNELCVLQLNLEWKDLGTYQTLETIVDKDVNGNAEVGNVFLHNSKNNFIYSDKNIICGLDIEDLLIIEKNNIMFVVHKNKYNDLNSELKKFEEKVKNLKFN